MTSPPSRPPLRARIAAGERLLGGITRMPNESLVELSGLVGLDYVVLDTEHGPADSIALHHHLLAAAASGMDVLVRVDAQWSPPEIQRALDLGAVGVVAPHVTSAAAAAAVVAAAHYPPAGNRGLATYTRAAGHGLRSAAEHLRSSAGDTVVVVMLEDPAGCRAAAEVAAVPGVDALLVGTGDLSVALGVPGQVGEPRVRAAVASVRAAAHSRGCASMSIVADANQARDELDAGTDLVLYNLQAALVHLLAELVLPPRPTG